MRVYIKSNYRYFFDKEKIFRARYIAKNKKSSQEYRENHMKNIEQRDLLLKK